MHNGGKNMMTHEEIGAAIERLRAIEPVGYAPSVAKVVCGFTDGVVSALEFRDALIALLEQADPDGWENKQLSEYGLVRLPKDRDGVPINVGEAVWDSDGNEWKVLEITLTKAGTVTYCMRDENERTKHTRSLIPDLITHHPPVTVESVLRDISYEAARAIENVHIGDSLSDAIYERIAEYANQLRLADE